MTYTPQPVTLFFALRSGLTFTVFLMIAVAAFAKTPHVTAQSPLADQKYHFTFDQENVEAYQSIIALRLSEGRARLREIRRKQPGNLIPVWLEDYADFFEAYIDEDEQDFERLEQRYLQRLELLEEGPAESPYYRYTRANIMLHWALARLKHGQYLTTFREARRAYKLLEENLEEHPDFVLTRKELGVLQAAVSTVPSGYQWGVEFVTGMKADLDGGRQHIERVLREQQAEKSVFLQETTAIYAFLLLNLADDEDGSWEYIRHAGFDPTSSLLGAFVMANIAMRTGRNDEAIAFLSKRPHSPHYYPFPYLDFMLGVCMQRKLDSKAEVYLRSFVEQKRTGNFIKEAYQKLAWQAILDGKEYAYFDELRQIKQFGKSVVGSDKNALREAELAIIPHRDLLKARLLFDGGYYNRAADAISAVNEAELVGEQIIEFPYRAARIAAARQRNEEASQLYRQTIAIGQDSPAYFACKSAVELGRMAESQRLTKAAEAYYELALDMHPAEYGPGLHQQAKAGLARLR